MKYPKVGDKFYWESSDGKLKENICVHIKKEPGRQYFIEYDDFGGRFINECNILDQNSERFKELKTKKEKEDWRTFWTKERIHEFTQYLVKHTETKSILKVIIEDFINSKIK